MTLQVAMVSLGGQLSMSYISNMEARWYLLEDTQCQFNIPT